MNSKGFILFCLGMIILGFSACCKKTIPNKQQDNQTLSMKSHAGPPVIIYKTKQDYSNQVPVGLRPDKKSLQSFPAPGDLYYNGMPATPLLLNDGYLLDQRGIGPDVAFLSITYPEYVKLRKTPPADSLLHLVIDADPLLEMYDCGSRYSYSDLVNEINQKLKESGVSTFKKLK